MRIYDKSMGCTVKAIGSFETESCRRQVLADTGTAVLEVQLRQADVRGDCQRQPSTASGRSPDRRLAPRKDIVMVPRLWHSAGPGC
jgi:hypothetical protein